MPQLPPSPRADSPQSVSSSSSFLQRLLLSRAVHSLLCVALRAVKLSLEDVRLGLATELSCLALQVRSVRFHTQRRGEGDTDSSYATHVGLAHCGVYFLPVYTYVAPLPASAQELLRATADPLPALEQQGTPLVRLTEVSLALTYDPPARAHPLIVQSLRLAIAPVAFSADLSHAIPLVDYANTYVHFAFIFYYFFLSFSHMLVHTD